MKSAYSKPLVVMRKYENRSNYDNGASKESVKVFCRMRPMVHPNDVSCMEVISDTSVVITSPETAMNFRVVNKAVQTSFSRVFGPDTCQEEVFNVVALPLIQNLITGRNSLLFTYGVTGSGKTYTMSGNPYDTGIMPRSLDVIFNTIAKYQARKFIFKPDKLNSFDVQSEADALLDRQNELHAELVASHNGKTIRLQQAGNNSNSNENVNQANKVQGLSIDEDNVYAVFVTYVEIYNNNVYDLLEENEGKTRMLQSKIIREDSNRNMYVHGGTEVEVKSSEEAFKVFQYGQCRKHIAYTALNAESSRSHCIFTIRLVQAPLDSQGEEVVRDKRVVYVSQLSLVDLAGSERSSRSKNTGQRLREAGNINNSLMTLRSCLEILRENQTQGTNKMVPFRDSKLTHLFKNFFDGEGYVRMIVCINPSAEDYDETIQVMKFAEVSQEVKVANNTPSRLDLGYTPGRRQANKMFKEARNRLEDAGHVGAANLKVDLGLVYSLGGPFPEMELGCPHNDEIITTLMRFLELRIQKRNVLRDDLRDKQNNFRNMLVKMEHENVALKIENAAVKVSNDQQKKKISALEEHICKTEAQIDTLLYRLNSANDIIRQLKQELKNKDMQLNQRAIDKQRAKEKYNSLMQSETDKMSQELESKLRQQRELLQHQMKQKEEKLNLVKQILVSEDGAESSETNSKESLVRTAHTEPKSSTLKTTVSETALPEIVTTQITAARSASAVTIDDGSNVRPSRKDRIPVVNLRYRRSRSANKWIDHRPTGLVPVGTIFQPFIRSGRSVTQLIDPREITDKASRYCLISQEQDTDGELETKLYKGDILPTSGGGAQVVFNDMEHLKQISPVARRKRNGCLSPEEKESSSKVFSATTENNSKKARV